MKLIRFGELDQEKPGVILPGGKRVAISEFGEDFDESFFGTDGPRRLELWLKQHESSLPEIADSVRLGAPICRPSKIICVGLNFADHARESKLEPPVEPVIFFKASSALVGPNDNLVIPRGSEKTDWEVELAVVIGKRASYVEESKALEHVAGYALHNDYSERAFQIERAGQWVKGKSCDSFAPLGPFLATPEELGDIDNLGMWLKVNGEYKQQGNSSNMIFKVPHIIAYLSQFMTLLPGDLISTGTPAGVGLGFNPPQFLKAGDVIELGIDGLGQSSQTAIAYKSSANHF